jgi:vacuolar-type H+-ATPase subunit D/Vma8
VAGPRARVSGVVSGMGEWQQALREELSQLPETLRQLREATANMHTVTRRLVDATAGLEQFANMSAAVAEAQRRVDAIASSLPVPQTDERVRKAVDDVREALTGMARLNPLWRSWSDQQP